MWSNFIFFGKIRRSRPLHHKKKTYVYWEWICFCWKIAFLFSIESEFEVFLSGFPVQSQILRRESKGYDNKWINKMSASAVVYESCSRWANNLIGCFIWLNGIQIGAMLFVSSLSQQVQTKQNQKTLCNKIRLWCKYCHSWFIADGKLIEKHSLAPRKVRLLGNNGNKWSNSLRWVQSKR